MDSYAEEYYHIEMHGGKENWVKVTWEIARSWSGRKRLNGEPWYCPSCEYLHGLSNPYVNKIRSMMVVMALLNQHQSRT